MTNYPQIPEIENKIIERYFALLERAPKVDKDTLSITINDVKSNEFPFEFYKRHDLGGPHLEYSKDGQMSLIFTERGQVLDRIDTYDLEEIMYELFRGVAGRASQFELWTRYKRDPKSDSRRVWMPLSVAFMAMIKPGWGQRLQKHYDEVLTRAPYTNSEMIKDSSTL